MVVVKIGDGLGNQMYNYVCGYSVAKADNDVLKLDTSDVDNSMLRDYGLDQFNIECTNRESFSNKSFFHKVYKRLRRNIKYNVIFERSDETNPLDMNVYKKKGIRNKYLHGYFQNIYYYNTCREEINRQFTPKIPFDEKMNILFEQLSHGNTCSFHVRGGDIKPLPFEYYEKAVDIMKKDNPDIKFVVFSNERKLAKEYADRLTDCNVVLSWELGKFRDFDELFLMKACNNHIISDSTFSRWAGFLDEKGGIVVAPSTRDDDKIYPKEWIKVPF